MDNLDQAEPDEETLNNGELPTEHNTKTMYTNEDNESCDGLRKFFAEAWIH